MTTITIGSYAEIIFFTDNNTAITTSICFHQLLSYGFYFSPKILEKDKTIHI